MKNSSMAVGKIIGREVTIFYPNSSGRVIIYTYADKMQLGIGISGKGRSISFYSNKSTSV